MKDWSWNPPEDLKTSRWLKTKDLKSSKKKRRKKKKQKSKKLSRSDNDKFYSSYEWRSLRVRVLEKYECKCMMCGRSPKLHGVVLNVDHIKPRRKYPHLSLVLENLQILCDACNHGKGNSFETDHRPDLGEDPEPWEIEIINEANKFI